MINESLKYKVIDANVQPKNLCGRCISDVRGAYRFKTNYEKNVLKGNGGDDFIDSLAAENWELVTDFIKKEQEDATEECTVIEKKPQIKTVAEENKPQTKTIKKENKLQIKSITSLKKVNTDDEASKESGKRVKANKKDALSFCGKQNINVARPYKCPHCLDAFVHAHRLKDHLQRYHTRHRPYNCPHCSSNFSRKGLLLDHVASRHFFVQDF